MQYLQIKNIHKSFTDKPLLAGVDFSISKWQKVALVAQNGMGKSTLLKIIIWWLEPSIWEVVIHKWIRLWFLDQTTTIDPSMVVMEALFHHDHPLWQLIKRYENMILDPHTDDHAMQEVLAEIEQQNAWEYETKVKTIIAKLQLTPHLQKTMWSLSWGEAKRVALAKALIDEPDMLILDEPTNHLDVEMIEWLEKFLLQSQLTLLMVTHDRYFLDSICTDIYELYKWKIYQYTGNYEDYLVKKAERQELEQRELHHMKQLWKQELAWVRKAPRWRWTKSVDREKKFHELDDSFQQEKSNHKQAAAKLIMWVWDRRLWSKIIKIHHLKKTFDTKCIIKDFSHDFKEWERVGIIGKNWVWKSTFVQILTGDMQPDSGNIERGEKVIFWHYQQKDILLHTEKRVIDVIRDIAPYTQIGKEKFSAAQLLDRFLFTPAMQQMSAYNLSGGEKKRLHLLMVLVENPNFLILDEPTNDLDLVTLSILEEFLLAYKWCLVIISHDRFFMDKIVDHIFAFEWDGEIYDFRWTYTAYTQDKARRDSFIKQQEKKKKDEPKQQQSIDASSTSITPPAKQKLTFQEKYEFENLGKEISILEKRVWEINFIFQYQTVWLEDMKKLGKEMDTLMKSLGEKETRWLELCERE